jgi:hypothetical protein
MAIDKISFEFDPEKSKVNKLKYKISFDQAKELWTDSFRVEIKAKTLDEDRYLIIGAIKKKIWCAIVTYREDKIRIISVRRARQNEEELYKSIRI